MMARTGAIYAGSVCAMLAVASIGCVPQDTTERRGISSGGAVGEGEQESDAGGTHEEDAAAGADTEDQNDTPEPDTVVDDGSGSCEPTDWICESGVQQFCEPRLTTSARSCAGDCSSDAQCLGDTCTDAIDVDLTTDQSHRISGDVFAYTDDWNAGDRPNCLLDGTGPGGDTPFADIYLRVRGHDIGDTLELSAEDSDTPFGFYVISACGAPGCLDAGAAADPLAPNSFSWRATTSDPVIVIAEALGAHRDRTFEITISTQ